MRAMLFLSESVGSEAFTLTVVSDIEDRRRGLNTFDHKLFLGLLGDELPIRRKVNTVGIRY